MNLVFDQVGYLINQYVPELYECCLFKYDHVLWISDCTTSQLDYDHIQLYKNLKKIIMNNYQQSLGFLENIKLEEIEMELFTDSDQLKFLTKETIKYISMPLIDYDLLKTMFPDAKINDRDNKAKVHDNNFNSDYMYGIGISVGDYGIGNIDCVALGFNARIKDGVVGSAAIGANAHVEQDDSLILGAKNNKVGIRTTKPGAALHIDGGMIHRVKVVSKNYIMTIDDYIVVVLNNSLTLKLPDPWSLHNDGHVFIIKNNGSGFVTIGTVNQIQDIQDFVDDKSSQMVTNIILYPGSSNTFTNIRGKYYIVQH